MYAGKSRVTLLKLLIGYLCNVQMWNKLNFSLGLGVLRKIL